MTTDHTSRMTDQFHALSVDPPPTSSTTTTTRSSLGQLIERSTSAPPPLSLQQQQHSNRSTTTSTMMMMIPTTITTTDGDNSVDAIASHKLFDQVRCTSVCVCVCDPLLFSLWILINRRLFDIIMVTIIGFI